LIDASLQLLEEGGPEKVIVRQAAKRAGVSSGAPFRHFPNRTALMAAVAEEALRRFQAEIASALGGVPADDPIARIRALGFAFLRWAIRNPTHFQVISTRSLFDYEDSQSLRRENEQIIALTEELVVEAQRRGLLRPAETRLIVIAGRALVYGLARMYTDGQFPRWGMAEAEAEQIANAAFDLWIAGIAEDRGDRQR